jgi:predicted PurR-regulated permease PerM
MPQRLFASKKEGYQERDFLRTQDNRGERGAPLLKAVYSNPWVQALAVLVAVVLLVLLAYFLSFVLVPLLLAFLVAYILDPVVDVFERRRIPRSVTIAVLAILALLLILFLPVYGVHLIMQADELLTAASQPEQVTSETGWAEWAEGLVDFLPLDRLVEYLGWAEDAGPEGVSKRPLQIIGKHVGAYVKQHAVQLLRSHVSTLASAGQVAGATAAQVISRVGEAVAGTIVFLANLAIFAFVAGYLLRDFDGLMGSVKDLIPPRYRDKTVHLAGKVDMQLRSFLRGQLTVCLCLGVLYAVGLVIADTPFALLIAVFGGIANLVPYLGIVLTIGPAIVLTLIQHQGLDWHVVAVILTFVVAQGIEGTLLTPNIVGEQVGLHPVWVILAILVFGSVLGFMGMLLAVPFAAGLKVVVEEGVRVYKNSPIFEGAGSSGREPASRSSGLGSSDDSARSKPPARRRR